MHYAEIHLWFFMQFEILLHAVILRTKRSRDAQRRHESGIWIGLWEDDDHVWTESSPVDRLWIRAGKKGKSFSMSDLLYFDQTEVFQMNLYVDNSYTWLYVYVYIQIYNPDQSVKTASVDEWVTSLANRPWNGVCGQSFVTSKDNELDLKFSTSSLFCFNFFLSLEGNQIANKMQPLNFYCFIFIF